jgi:hypothetical protein
VVRENPRTMHKKIAPPTEILLLQQNNPKLAVDLFTAADMISVCRRTPARKIGKRTVIRVCDLEAFFALR